MSLVTFYAQAVEDLCIEAWVTLLFEGDEGQITVRYGTDPENLVDSVNVTGAVIPERTEYIYHVKLTGLTPATLYHFDSPGLFSVNDVKPIRTLPEAMPQAGIRLAVLSDTHAGYSADTMGNPTEMDIVADQNPDLLLVSGDLVDQSRETLDSTNGGLWIDGLADYFSRMSTDYLVPIVPAPGNHDVGNHTWDGTGNVNKTDHYYHVFFPALYDLEPNEQNYAAIKIGDYLQLLPLDTHSAQPLDVGDWLADGVIDPSVPVAIPFHHSPMFADDIRHSNDPPLQKRVRDGMFRTYVEAENIVVAFTGHVHNRVRTLPLGIVETEPTGDTIQIFDTEGNPDGWAVEQENGLLEIGQGYRTDRGEAQDMGNWPLAVAERDSKNFNLVTLTQGQIEVQTLDTSGEPFFDQQWERPRSPKTENVRRQNNGVWRSVPLRSSGASWLPRALRRVKAGAWQ